MIAVLAFDVQQHHHEQVEHQNGARVHDHLHGSQELGVQRHVQPGHMEKHDQQGEDAVDGIAKGHHQESGQDDDASEVIEEEQSHVALN